MIQMMYSVFYFFLVQICYAGYAWDEVMMPKQIKKNKSVENQNFPFSVPKTDVDNVGCYHHYFKQILLVKSQTSILHSHIHDSFTSHSKTTPLSPMIGVSNAKSLFKEISFDWKDPSPHG